MSELAVKPWRTVRAPMADRPQLRVPHHQRLTSSLEQLCDFPADRPRLSSGPSAPQQRTVRSLTFEPKPEKHPLWYKSEISRRTVRAPWADCPPFNFEAHTDRHPFWYKFEIQWRTVRPSGPDRPRAHQSHCKLSGTGADCPPLPSQLSNLVCFKTFQNAVSPHACN